MKVMVRGNKMFVLNGTNYYGGEMLDVSDKQFNEEFLVNLDVTESPFKETDFIQTPEPIPEPTSEIEYKSTRRKKSKRSKQ